MTCQHTVSLGVYLLGALEPTERHDFEAHLATCDTCRSELVRLSPLPGLLNQITPEDFEEELPPTTVEQVHSKVVPLADTPLVEPLPPPPPVTADTPGRPPRRYGRVAAAAAVAVLLALGGVFGWQALRHPPQEPPPGVTWTATSPQGVTGEATLVDHEWGTEVQVTMGELPPGKKCYLVVFDHYGRHEVAGWWGTDHDPNEVIPASTSILRSNIERLEFKLDERTTVLTIEPPAR